MRRATSTREQRHALVLRAWEAINMERELQGVLAAVAGVIVPVVPFATIGIVSFEGDKHDLYDLHVVGTPRREGETLQQFLSRPEMAAMISRPLVPQRPIVPYSKEHMMARDGEYYMCPDILEKETWYEHEAILAAGGIRTYLNFPLFVRGKLIGVTVITRREPRPFSPEEIGVLSDVSRALAIAAANALANEEIRKLHHQLEAENIELRAQLGQAPWFEDIVGDSPALRRVLEAVEHVAPTGTTVLISGETGTGKELVARGLHRRSARARGPLVKFNCAAVPDTLLASELFGHERGAFTGAVERRKGRFEQAHGGTVFLDEVGELPPELQVMLLRVLQEREFERLGGSQTVQVDVRVIAATNRDLSQDVRAGHFRDDLFYRLNVFPIRIPPLRERPEDIPLLVAHFAARHSARLNRPITRIERRTMNLLQSYDWPGNIRELENAIERAVIVSRNGTLAISRDALPAAAAGGSIEARLRQQEREAIESALRASNGRVAGPSGAAKRLGLAPSTLEFRIRRLGIERHRHRR